MRKCETHDPRWRSSPAGALATILAASAIIVMLGSSNALAQPVWQLDRDKFDGYTEGYANEFPVPPSWCWITNQQTTMVSGMLLKDKAGTSNAYCGLMGATCPLIGRGFVYFWVDGIGTPVVTIKWHAGSRTFHSCERPFYQAWGIADLIGDLGLKITGATPGTPVTADYYWDIFSFNNLRHEAGNEDPAFVRNGILRLKGGDLFNGDFDFDNVRGWLWNNSTGSLDLTVGDIVDFHVEVLTDAEINDPGRGAFNRDSASAIFDGKMVLSLSGPPHVPPPGEPKLEFSLDIGSDTELSDPHMDGDEVFDPGDAYLWHGPALPAGGNNGIKDDSYIFGTDPWPIPAIAMYTAAPTCTPNTPPEQVVKDYFDLDGHDNVDFSVVDLLADPMQDPIARFSSNCVMPAQYLIISYDDDSSGHYVGDQWSCEVPVKVQSPGLDTYGTTVGQHEIIGLNLITVVTPAIVGAQYPIEDEVSLHPSLRPNPDPRVDEKDDDDVDSLDIICVQADCECNTWLFSPDHEATYVDASGGVGLDPGGIYEVIPAGGGFVQVIDEVVHLGLDEDTDIDAFEFVWTMNPDTGNEVLTLLFSVDEDDWLTSGVDESGGQDPRMLYASYLTGSSFPFLDAPLDDDVDALTAWRTPLVTSATNDCNGNGVPDSIDIANGTSRDCNGNGIPDECEILGDMDNDADVDFVDHAMFAEHWGRTNCGTCGGADFTCDGNVRLDDLRELIADWLVGK